MLQAFNLCDEVGLLILVTWRHTTHQRNVKHNDFISCIFFSILHEANFYMFIIKLCFFG